jgi:GH24 family phage-related lysozyme (muramidase)
MKKLILAVLAFVLLVPFTIGAQTLIDSMVTSNINTRRSEYVYKSRKHWRKKKPSRKIARKKVIRRKRSRG